MTKAVKVSLSGGDERCFDRVKDWLRVGADAEVFRILVNLANDNIEEFGTIFLSEENTFLSKKLKDLEHRVEMLESFLKGLTQFQTTSSDDFDTLQS